MDTFLLWGWSFGATLGLHMASANPCRLEKAVIAGTYFGRIFTEEYVEKRVTQASTPVERARWNGLVSCGDRARVVMLSYVALYRHS